MNRADAGLLLRPSQLARFWELHPKTVHDWIRSGRLVAIRSPGGQYRVRVRDLRDFCEGASMTVPPFALPRVLRVCLAGGAAGARRGAERALEELDGAGGEAAALESHESALEGLFAAVRSPPSVLALDAGATEVDPNAAVRALRGSPATADMIIVAFNAATSARAETLAASGATRALVKRKEPTLAAVLVELLRALL